ncbi:MAG: hypothetical protein GC154_07930 [bacterium]|nr:hypothetical protein [bacterium]
MSEQVQEHQTPQKSGSGFWVGFWLTLVIVGAVAGVGVYLDYRLQQFEDELASHEDSIMKGRQESAEFANRLTTTLNTMSDMLTKTVNSFTDHTAKLASVIENKEKSQSDHLQTVIEELNQNIKQENESLKLAVQNLSRQLNQTQAALHTVSERAESQEQKLAEANQKIAALETSVKDDFSNLTKLANAMGESVQAQFEAQAVNFNSQVSALNDSSNRTLEAIHQDMKSVADRVDGLQAKQEENSQNVAQVASQLAGLKQSQNDFADKFASTSQCIDNTASLIEENLKTLANNMDGGFASSAEQTETLRADLAELGYSLTERTEELLVQMMSSTEDSETAADQAQKMSSALDSYTKNVSSFIQNLNDQIDSLNQSVQAVGERINQHQSNLVSEAGSEQVKEKPAPIEEGKPIGLFVLPASPPEDFQASAQ